MKTSRKTCHNKLALLILSACAITSLTCATSLQAEPFPQRGPIPFYIYDIDASGAISQDEFQATRQKRMDDRAAQGYPMRDPASEPNFAQFDTDKDGQLNPEELARGQQQQRQKRQAMRPAQGMGMRQQGMGRQGQGSAMGGGRNMPRFEDFDRNKDGVLTPEEFSWGLQQHRQKRRAMRQGMGMRQPGMGRQGQGSAMGAGRQMPRFEEFDLNKDGFISEQELIEARSMRISKRIQQGYQMRNTANIPQFQEIDKNADAKISPDEFSAHQKQHQLERQKGQ